ncbi:MAG TPA: hypothetical protein VMV04_04770 [Thermodesulfobacteriota bacterium]|nr:hypothetical protein [Thermodesulfobacteriota bacterium]
MWEDVKFSLALALSPSVRPGDLRAVGAHGGRGAGEEAGSLVKVECHTAVGGQEK